MFAWQGIIPSPVWVSLLLYLRSTHTTQVIQLIFHFLGSVLFSHNSLLDAPNAPSVPFWISRASQIIPSTFPRAQTYSPTLRVSQEWNFFPPTILPKDLFCRSFPPSPSQKFLPLPECLCNLCKQMWPLIGKRFNSFFPYPGPRFTYPLTTVFLFIINTTCVSAEY